MGDNIYLGDRNGVRTPMQWSPDRNAGFSQADPQRLFLPPIMDPIYGYEAVNVEAQSRDPSSLLNWMRRMLGVRDQFKGFGRGTLRFLRAGNRKILAFVREYGEETILCVANLARTAQPVELDLSRFKGRVPIELIGRAAFPPIGDLPYLLTLHGHGFFWFRLALGEEAPDWHVERIAREEPPVLVLFDGWHSFFRDRVVPWRIAMAESVRAQLETEVLPRFVATQRWHGEAPPPPRVALTDQTEWLEKEGDWLLGIYAMADAKGESQPAFLPLALVWEDSDEERLRGMSAATVARARHQARIGALTDALADERFCRALINAVAAGREFRCASGAIHCTPTPSFTQLADERLADLPVRGAKVHDLGLSAVALGRRVYLKCHRRPEVGPSAEQDMGRFLTEVAHYANTVPVFGSVEYRSDDGRLLPLVILQGYVDNQGTGAAYTLDYLARHLEHGRSSDSSAVPPAHPHGLYLALMRTLGKRVAEMHRALALTTGDPAFDPHPIEREDMVRWARAVRDEANATLDALHAAHTGLPTDLHQLADALVARRDEILGRIDDIAATEVHGLKTRHHGNLRLGRVLLAQNDFVIVDFAAHGRHSPLYDVATMLRSIDGIARTALERAPGEKAEDFATAQAAVHAWRDEASGTFLQAYREATHEAGLFGDWHEARALIDLFALEAALSELRGELALHPERVGLLLRGIPAHG
jgi:maltose alpha-D-glucosyltransferase/alpha-amylase